MKVFNVKNVATLTLAKSGTNYIKRGETIIRLNYVYCKNCTNAY